MKVVRGRADARWLPSRYNFALFRLAAFFRMRNAKPEPADVLLIIDRHQSAFENFAVSLWILLTVTCYVTATFFASWPRIVAIIAAIPVAGMIAQAPYILMAPLLAPFSLRDETRLRTQSMLMMSLHLIGAGWFATRTSWVRFAAWQVLGFAALNAVAAVLVFLLRDPIARMENAFGGAASEH